jgi:hypothetical protein
MFAEMMTSLGEYYGKTVSPSLISMYWQGLEKYDLAALREAFNRHVNNPDTGQFMPKIADVSRMLGGTSNDRALGAWAKVDKAVRHVGTYRSVAFDDPIIHRVIVEMGGWIALGTKTDDEWPFIAKEFENRYRGYAMRGERPEYQPVLLGISDAHNAKEGFKKEEPMLIGDATKAQEVMKLGVDRPMIGFTQANSKAAVLHLVGADKSA